ncbi:hypothetical protein Trydic_g20452 [Trypoxylus dichotomus]
MSTKSKNKYITRPLFNCSTIFATYVDRLLRIALAYCCCFFCRCCCSNNCSAKPPKFSDSRLFPDENRDRVDVGPSASVSDNKDYVVQLFPTKNNEIFMSVGWKRTDSGGYECFLEYRKLRLCFVRVCMWTVVFLLDQCLAVLDLALYSCKSFRAFTA